MFLLFFSSSLLLLYNFFLIRHIYIIHAETKRLLSLWSKIIFTLCRKFSSEKVFLLFTTRYYFIFSDNYIYLTLYFSLVAICQWPLSSLRIPPDWLLCIPTRASPRKNSKPNLSRNKRFKRAPSKSDCKSNTFLLHHQTFYKLFLGKKKSLSLIDWITNYLKSK